MQDIRELSLLELGDILRLWKEPAFHARQIFSWLYKKGAVAFSQMSDLPLNLRKRLEENFFIFSLKLARQLKSRDGTEKFLFQLEDKNLIEALSIPTEKRLTCCISSQLGCKFGCRFCASGLSGFKRNLTSAEMIAEVLSIKNLSQPKKITHIVFMGSGEPLDNYEAVLKAVRMINSAYGLNIAARRITISTCGITPAIKRLAEEHLQVELSVSLHAASEPKRSQLLPVNKKYPLRELISACRQYIKKTGRQLTFEYILIKGINSGLPDAQKLATILKGLICKVNLIPVNLVKECNIEPPNKIEILLFRDYLVKQGVNATLRKPRGQDIQAACGQLRSSYEDK